MKRASIPIKEQLLYSGKSLINNVFDASIPIKEQLLSVYTKELYAYQIGFNSYRSVTWEQI